MNTGVGAIAAASALLGGVVGMYGGLFVGTLVVSPYHLTEERSNQAMGIGGFVGVLGGAFLGAALSAPSSGGTTASAGTGAGPRLPASSRPRGLAQLSPR